jgi:hypothetical protein
LVLAACSSKETQLLVVVDSDLDVPGELSVVRAVLRDEAGKSLLEHSFAVAPSGTSPSAGFVLPMSFGVGPRNGDSSLPITVEVQAISTASEVMFARRAITRFLDGKQLVLPMYLSRLCTATTCAASETCTENGCLSAEIDPSKLCEGELLACLPPRRDGGVSPRDVGPEDIGLDREPPDRGPIDGGLVLDAEPGDAPIEDVLLDGGVIEGPPMNVREPKVLGAPIEGQALTADDGEWASVPPVEIKRQWQLCDVFGRCTDLPGETGTTYTPRRIEIDDGLKIVVSAKNPSGTTIAESMIAGPVRRRAPSRTGFFTGFEVGSNAALSEGSDGLFGAASVVASAARSGGFGMAISPARTEGYYQRAMSSGVVVLRFAVRFATVPTGMNENFLVGLVSAQTPVLAVSIDANGNFTLVSGNLAQSQSGAAVIANRWHLFDLRYDGTASPQVADWRIDGIAQPSLSIQGLAGTITQLTIGARAAAMAFGVDYDDLALSQGPDQYPIGDGAVVGLAPNASGAHVGMGAFLDSNGQPIAQGETTTWQLLDDWPVNDGLVGPADFVRTAFAGQGSYLEYPLADPALTGEPRAIRATFAMRMARAQEATSATGRVVEGGVDRAIVNVNLQNAEVRYFSATLNERPSGGPWTHAALDELLVRWGPGANVGTSGGAVLDAVLIEADIYR